MRAIMIWALLSLAWAGGVATDAIRNGPRVPLDMSRTDPATVAALNRALVQHAAVYAGLAIGPPLLVLGVGWLVCRRPRPRLTTSANTGTNKS
jgi:hypothetical protein